jgi:hypothetical protein
MRLIKYLASLVAVAMVLSLGALAKDHDSGSFDLTQAARVGSTTLQPGHYKAEWTGPNNALHVAIVKNGETVATATAKMKELSAKARNGAVVLRTTNNHNPLVEEIDFSNRTDALVLSGV